MSMVEPRVVRKLRCSSTAGEVERWGKKTFVGGL